MENNADFGLFDALFMDFELLENNDLLENDQNLENVMSKENQLNKEQNRFAKVDVDKFLENSTNNSTKKKTEGDMKLFINFLFSKGDHRLPEFIPPTELNEYVSEFLISVRKRDGSEFEPTSIRGLVSSLDRYLRSKSSCMSIVKDKEFEKSRNVLKSKQKQLKSIGLGNKPKTAEPLNDTHLSTMYEAQTLGDSNPRALMHSLWLICTTHFGMRTGQEVHNLRWGDVQLGLDETCGQEYLILNTERQTKTRTGSNHKDTRILKPRAYSKPEVPCQDPVYLYKLFSEKRPETMMDADSPFFLTPGHSNQKCWYKKTPMGISKLYNIMNEMKADAGIENSRITPYSSRKMLIQKLSDEGVPPNQIVQISGHKNVNSLNNYSRINSNQSKHISSILSGSPKATNQVAVTTGPSAPACSFSSQFPRNSDQNSSTTMPGYFMNCHFHGNITFNISKNESHHVDNQSTCTVSNLTQNSPVVAQQYKRIRLLSDSDRDLPLCN